MTIKELREARGLTQQQAAEKIGISIHTIRRYEQGNRKVHGDFIQQMAKVYKVNVNKILEARKQATKQKERER